jgi:hypothetical protein
MRKGFKKVSAPSLQGILVSLWRLFIAKPRMYVKK